MPDFHNLQNVLDMDFSKMRGLTCEGGRRATDEAILFFVANLAAFFSQFEAPGRAALQKYLSYMNKITDKINESEYAYYLEKYKIEDPKYAEYRATASKLKSYKDLPKRMQYWAAAEKFGDSIRNPETHGAVVKKMSEWARAIDKNHGRFFKAEDESIKNEPLSPNLAIAKKKPLKPLGFSIAKTLNFDEGEETTAHKSCGK